MDQPNSSILSSSFLSQLISQKLNHSNYLTWKRQIVPFIKSHRLYGHIDGTTPAPPQYIDREVKRTVVADQGSGASTGSEIRFEYETVTENNPAYEVWLAHDQSLVAYITSTLSEEVLGGVDDDLTALELWSTLATTYSQVSEARFLQLRRQFQDIKRGTHTVLEYLNEIKSVSDQLAAIGHPVSDKDKVQQALSRLGTEFDIFCTALEVLPILPSFEDLKAKLFQHEASRVQRQNLIPSNSHNVLITGTHAIKDIVPVLGPLRQEWEEVFFQPLQNKNNHIRREGKAAAGAASSSSGQNMTSNIPADAQQLLMTAISKLQLKQNEQGEWYVDSGAAAHVTGDTGNLSSVFPYLCQGSVVTGDGSHHTISHIGNARISMGNSSIPLKNVLVVPSVKKNIISVSKLIDDTHSFVEFTPSSVYVKDVRTKKTFAEGTCNGDMYVLEEAPTMSKQPRLSESCFSSHSEVNIAEHNKPSIWHGRLAHCSQSFVRSLVADGLLDKSSLSPASESGMCSSCHIYPTRSDPNGLPDRRLHRSPAERQAGDGVPPVGHPTPWVATGGYCQRRRTSAATMAGRRPPETGRFWPVSPISRSAPFPIFRRLKTAATVPPATLGGRGREARRRPATGNASGGGDAQVDSGIGPSRSTALPLVACPASPFFCRLQRQTQGSDLCRWVVAGGRRLNGQKPPAHPATNA
ncbi:hypothetical protein EJ110_NYTH27691 [Nymphaea thermarum]|nr:hypothetical protein EJ110_NYTH27691 [Nymphaea thermarum]